MTARTYDMVDAAERERAIIALRAQLQGLVGRRDDLAHELIGIAKELDETAVGMFVDREPGEAWATWNILAETYRRIGENLNDQKRTIEGWQCVLRELRDHGVTDADA